MIVGVPREIKTDENRVAITPAGVSDFVKMKHQVLIEKGAGVGSGFGDDEYRREGAALVNNPADVYRQSDMIMKVKEPQPAEIGLLREGQVLYTYLHLAPDKKLTVSLLERRVVGVAYETIEVNGRLVCLEPMSEIAGKMSAIMGAFYIAKQTGGKGILAGGVAGVHSANILILGGGTAGANAAKIAGGLGARVIVMDIDIERMRYLEDILPENCEMIMSNKTNIEYELSHADIIIGSVLIAGARAPRLVTREMLKLVKPGTVIVDVSIDQGGCIETSRPTTHSEPVYDVDGVIHYCVSNMPGAYPRSSTLALTNATLPFGLQIANLGWKEAALRSRAIASGINLAEGMVVCKPVADAHGLPHLPVEELLGEPVK